MPQNDPIIKRRNGIVWYAYDFRHKDKRYRGWLGAASKMTKRKASEMLRSIYAGIVTDKESPEEQAPRKPAGRILKDYSDYLKAHKPKTYRTYKYICHHFEKFFTGDKTTRDDVIRYESVKLKEGVSGASINRHLSYCRAAYNMAEIVPNPFNKFRRFDEDERSRYLTEDELKRLLGAVLDSPNQQLRGIVLTAILTGLRKDNILKLHSNHIDFSRQTITIPGRSIKGNKPLMVPLPDQLVLLYKRNLKEHSSGYVFENAFTKKPFGDVKHSWTRVKEDAKIQDFVFHDLRHTFATYALIASKNVRTVQELLGHRNIRMTQKYTHVLAEQKRETINLLGDFIMGTEENKTGEEE